MVTVKTLRDLARRSALGLQIRYCTSLATFQWKMRSKHEMMVWALDATHGIWSLHLGSSLGDNLEENLDICWR